MDAHALRYWIAFNRVNGIGAARFHGLLDYFNGDLEAAWHAPETDLLHAVSDTRACASIVKARKAADLDADWAMVGKVGARVMTLLDDDYPLLLRQIDNPPPLLYIKGELRDTDKLALGVVGTRKPSAYGIQVTQELVGALCRAGLTIVSGLAKGIDGVAHRTAIGGAGRTVALLGHGIERVYPSEHAALADQIVLHGALLTEFPIGTPPDGNNFPMRNRLISGMTLGVVVIEAQTNSGALVTARQALDQGREVFAVPGSIYALESSGTHLLIQSGQAKLITQTADILAELNLATPSRVAAPPVKRTQSTSGAWPLPTDEPAGHDPEQKNDLFSETSPTQSPGSENAERLSENETLLLSCLSHTPRYVDELCGVTGWHVSQINATLSLLDIRGLILQKGVRSYVLAT